MVHGNIYAAQKFDRSQMVKAGLAETERLHMALLCLEPGQGQEAHTHDGSDKVYYVVEGVASVSVGAENHELGPGTFAVAKAGEPHGLKNNGRDRLTVLVFAAPPPHGHAKGSSTAASARR